MKKLFLLLAFIGFMPFIAAFTVANKSDFDLWGAVYYFRKEAERATEPQFMPKGQKVEFALPKLKFGKKRKLVFSLNKDDLKDRMSSSDYHLLPHMGVGIGKRFYVDLDKGSFKGFTFAQWKVFEPLKKKFGGVSQKLDDLTLGQIRRSYRTPEGKPLPALSATVRRSTDIYEREKSYVDRRRPHVKQALEGLLGEQLSYDEVPTITFAGSGGGYRAMLGCLGMLQGAEEAGLLDTATYISGLSGSTWTLGPWISSGWSLDEFKNRLLPKIATDIYKIKPSTPELIKSLMVRVAFKQPVTAVNAYGKVLAYNLLNDIPGGPFNIYLHNQVEKIQDGSKPFPIYTAVATKLPYQWVEFTPFEMGGDYFGGYIPIWAFGAPFLNGTMQYATPPYGLDFILAICGSAFAARLQRIAREAEAKIPFAALGSALRTGAEEFKIGKHRASAARVFNWTWGMQPLPRAQQDIIKLIDGGISYNFGLEALYRRKPQFIIIGDFSASQVVGNELMKAERDLKARGFKVPPIDYTDIDKKTVSVFKDPQDPETPVIIYLPHIKNQHSTANPRECLGSWCSTFNFKYTPEQANSLIDLSKGSMKDAAPIILDEIKQWIAAKRPQEEVA